MAFTTEKDAEPEKNIAKGGIRAGHDTVRNAKTGLRIRPMDGADLERVQALRRVVSWAADPRAFDLLRGMRDARWSVTETRNGDLVGMIGAVSLGGVGIICHLAVHDSYRGFGLGARLTSWAVAYLRSRGVTMIRLYSTLQAKKIYRTAGFRPTTPRTVYRLDEITMKPLAFNGGHRVETLTTGDLPEVYGLDLWSSGADRSALILATLKLHPGRGLLARDSSGRIKGYLIRSSTPRAVHIGLFVAENPDVARLLMDHALKSQTTPVEVTVTTPRDTSAHHLFEEFGFVGHKDRMQMELGAIPVMYRRTGLEHYGTTPYLAT